MSVGGGLDALQFFWSLRKGTRTFHFRQNEPSCDILGPLGRYDDLIEGQQAPLLCPFFSSVFMILRHPFCSKSKGQIIITPWLTTLPTLGVRAARYASCLWLIYKVSYGKRGHVCQTAVFLIFLLHGLKISLKWLTTIKISPFYRSYFAFTHLLRLYIFKIHLKPLAVICHSLGHYIPVLQFPP